MTHPLKGYRQGYRRNNLYPKPLLVMR